MAAEGMTNREIGETLFVTIKTVETHLSNVYRKQHDHLHQLAPSAHDRPRRLAPQLRVKPRLSRDPT
jgi:DNA-binding NarL/FixJ family response regulator